MTTDVSPSDIINALASIADGSPLAALRAQKPDVQRHTQGSDGALFNPADPGGLSLIERELVGLRVAKLTDAPEVASRHRARLKALHTDAGLVGAAEIGDAKTSPRLDAIFQFADTLTRHPRAATPAAIERLTSVGLSDKDVVTLGQLIAYLNYQVRLLAGLRALGAPGATATGGAR
jgi:CMD domain protein